MSYKRYKNIILLVLNLFVPGSANIALSDYNTGIVLVLCSQAVFFSIPFTPLFLSVILYLLILIVSYMLLFKGGMPLNGSAPFIRTIAILIIPFVVLSIFVFNFTHHFMADDSSGSNNKIVYVLGTKPFKKESTEKMLNMSSEELFTFFNNDIHPFFRRLRNGLNEIGDGGGILLISAGKNQKKIVLRILDRAKKSGVFFSCRSTKEEIIALKKYIAKNGLAKQRVIIVSDDYHAFRALLYAKLYGVENVRFISTSYKFSFISSIKIYLAEQSLFLLSYLSFLINIFSIIV